MISINEAIIRSRQMIDEALARARDELHALDVRRTELVQQIALAEAMLRERPLMPESDRPSPREGSQLTLHEALATVLEDTGNEWMTARELADSVNRRGLYRKRDGSPVEANQVHARVNKYGELFEKNGPKIRMQEAATLVSHESRNVVMFKDDDDAFFEWQDANPQGQFINTERKPNPNYLVLHRSGCPHFKGADAVQWTKDYVKIASPDRIALDGWANETVGGQVTLCRTCYGR